MRAARTVLTFALLLAAVPLATLALGLRGGLDPLFAALVGAGPSDAARPLFAGGAAVAVAHLVLAAFVVAAWREPPLGPRDGAGGARGKAE
jgi:hypothetical protein